MTLLTLGWAAEYAETDLAFASLWPETYVATAAMARFGGDEGLATARSPQIMADAAIEILSREPGEVTGQCFIDADLLRDSRHDFPATAAATIPRATCSLTDAMSRRLSRIGLNGGPADGDRRGP